MEVSKISDESQNKSEVTSSNKNFKSKSKELEPVQNGKKSKDKEGKKKDDKSVEQILKSLNALGTNEEKLTVLCKKYSDTAEDNKKLNTHVKQLEKKCLTLQKEKDQLAREKDQLQSEQSKTILTRSRLENLCRELQRQNKAIKEESLLKIREEEEKRKVVSAKFQTALSEITALMQQNNENYASLKDENLEMQNKFKALCEQYELREQQVEKMSKQMQLESQLADVKLAKVKVDMVAETEVLASEKERLLVELTAYQNKCQEMQKTEAALRNQITMYTQKYDEFQSALSISNQIYSACKTEIKKMSKKIGKLEKDTLAWKMKWEGSHKALLQMAAEKQERDADLALTLKQLNQLQKLCRTLQSDRTSLIQQIKSEGKTPNIGAVSEDSTSDQTSTDSNSQPQNIKVTGSSITCDNIKGKDNPVKNTPEACENPVEEENVPDDKSGETEQCMVQKELESEGERNLVKEMDIIKNETKLTDDKVGSDIVSSSEENTSIVNNNDNKDSDSSGYIVTVNKINDCKKDHNLVKLSNSNEQKKGKEGSKKRRK